MKSIHIRKITKLLKNWNQESEEKISSILESYIITDPLMVKTIIYHIEKNHTIGVLNTIKSKLSHIDLDTETADKILSAVL